jgi:hypothetical protein
MIHACDDVDCVLNEIYAVPVHAFADKLLAQLLPSLPLATIKTRKSGSFFVIQTAFRLCVKLKNGASTLGLALQLVAVKNCSHLPILAAERMKNVP